MMYSIILIIILLLLSAFFSASETAVMSVSRSKLQKLKMDGNKKAIILAKLRGDDKEKFIGSILLGNNFANIAASAIATSISIDLFGESGVAPLLATVFMTIIILIYSEVLPKTYAVRHSEKVGLKVAGICTFLTRIFYPITFTIRIIVDKTLHLMVKDHNNKDDLTGLDAIRGAIDLHHEEGEVFIEDKFMLGGVIDLEEIRVEEIMIHRNHITSINIDDTIENITDRIINSPYSRMPIWQGDPENIISIIHIRDFVKLLHSIGPRKIKVSDISGVAREPWFIPNTTTLKTQLTAFRDKHYHFALVVDEYGNILGLLTLEDIVEEVVGQIEDEYDRGGNKVKVLSENSVISYGDTTIRDLNRMMNWDIDDEHVSTIGGLLIHSAEKVPEISDKIIVGNYKLKLLKKTRNKIIKVKISKI
jgi:Mg2+/Co2+ transporter CorB